MTTSTPCSSTTVRISAYWFEEWMSETSMTVTASSSGVAVGAYSERSAAERARRLRR